MTAFLVIDVGTTGVGSLNLLSASTGTALSRAVSGLPTSGTLYVRLWSLTAAGWQSNDYTYGKSADQAVEDRQAALAK